MYGTGWSGIAPAGRWTTATPTPERIADELVAALATPAEYVPVPTDGADRAAQLVVELL